MDYGPEMKQNERYSIYYMESYFDIHMDFKQQTLYRLMLLKNTLNIIILAPKCSKHVA